jgi:hypothetical protein
LKAIYTLFVFMISILFYPLSSANSFDGPLQVKNQYPIFLHANQQYIDKASLENSMSFSLSHSSTYTVQESGHWTINLDMEITELNLRYKRIIRDMFEINLDLPVLIIGAGFMDGFLADYHDTFGFADYGRSARPHNAFLYEVRRDGRLIIKGSSSAKLGDIRLAVKKKLMTADNLHLSVKGDIEIPVSSPKQGFSNGSIDAGVAFLIDKKITDSLMAYLNLGAVFPGDVRGHETLDIDNFFHGGIALEADAGKGLFLIAQIQAQSSIYPDTDLLAVDRDAYLLGIGGRYKKGKRSFELSLTEDINTAGAPDFIINLTYKINL